MFAVIGARSRGIEHDLRVWMGRAVQADLLTRRDRNRNQACGGCGERTNVGVKRVLKNKACLIKAMRLRGETSSVQIVHTCAT